MVYHGNRVPDLAKLPMRKRCSTSDRLNQRRAAKCVSGFQPSASVLPIWCVDVLINNECVDALALITHRADNLSQSRGRELVEKMKDLTPRQ